MLLGLYDADGKLKSAHAHLRRRCRNRQAPRTADRRFGLQGPGAPEGKSRLSGKERVPVPLKPVLVVEVSADHITGGHMRHGARLLRWQTDKAPESCTMDQISR